MNSLLTPCAPLADLQDHLAERTNADLCCLLHNGRKLNAGQQGRRCAADRRLYNGIADGMSVARV